MNYYFDWYGWLSDVEIPNRVTQIAPPSSQLPDGYKWNFTGIEWISLPYNPPTGEQNAATANQILADTDWASIPAVADPSQSNPYLINQNAWLEYRSKIRNIAVNKIAGYLVWETPPEEIWSN